VYALYFVCGGECGHYVEACTFFSKCDMEVYAECKFTIILETWCCLKKWNVSCLCDTILRDR